ncbi:MAG: CARDB domain-containing protein, partial [Thermoplasmata archaeon]
FGPHQLEVDIINPYPTVTNGSMVINFTVLPRILIVDGENNPQGNLTSYYTFDLNADDFMYSVVPAQNLNSLSSYDIVIWIEKDYSITTSQLNMLNTFLQNGKNIWFIDPNGYYASLFGINTQNSSNYNTIVAQGNGINLKLPNGSQFFSILSQSFDKIITPGNYNTLLEDQFGNTVAVYGNNGKSKFIYFSFEFSSIRPLYLQNFLSYRLIMWLLGINSLNVNDLAIADIIVSNYHPLYHKPINITVAVRNNGPVPLSYIPVSVYIDNQLLVESRDNSVISWTLNGGGNFTLLMNYTWIANTPGIHTLYVVVDQNNLFNEPNMNNNFVTENYLFPGIINVQFSTLIVGNDTNYSNIKSIFNAFQALGYPYTFYNESDIRSNSSYPTGVFFSQYNLVIWEGGSNQYSLGGLNSIDAKAIMNYMTNYNGSVLFLGSNIGNALSNSNYNGYSLTSQIGVTPSSQYSKGSWILFGINYKNGGDQLTRGMDLIYSGQMQKISINSGSAIFDQNALATNTPLQSLYPYYYKVYNNVQTTGIGVRGSYGPSQFAVLPLDFSGIKGILREMSN